MSKVAVIGAGSWGTAIAGVAAASNEVVSLWAHSQQVVDGINGNHVNPRYLVDYELPHNVCATSNLADCTRDADVVLFVVPSTHLREVAAAAAGTLDPHVPVCVLTKGVEQGSGKLMSDVLIDELGGADRIAALSGPNHAEEICQGMYAAAVVACPHEAVAEKIRDALVSRSFRVYVSQDLVGVETCGATKNVIAIACGLAQGLGYGDNTEAVLMTRGLAEIGRVVAATGGQPLTCIGLAGMGDLVATCTSEHSRNRSFGVACSKGTTLEEYEASTHMVVEGAHAARSVSALARTHGVEVPITEAIDAILHGGVPINEALGRLIDRVPTTELYGLKDE